MGLRLEHWNESTPNIQSQTLQNADGWLVTYQGAASQLDGTQTGARAMGW
jgi:hypothetical protein